MDPDHAPQEQRARVGMGRVALIVIVTIVALFAVYNLYYALSA
jgi:hypothetical protein